MTVIELTNNPFMQADPTFEGTAMVNISSQINKPMILVTLASSLDKNVLRDFL